MENKETGNKDAGKKTKSCKDCKYLFCYDKYHSYAICKSPKNDGCANPTRCKET